MMDRRRIVTALSSAAFLAPTIGQAPETALAQGVRMRGAEYLGAMGVMRHTIDWVEDEVTRLLDDRDEEDDDWRVDILAPFAVVEAVQDASQALLPPAKYDGVHDTWLEALIELDEAGVELRTAVFDEDERSYDLAERAMSRASDLLNEVDDELPGRVAQLTQIAS